MRAATPGRSNATPAIFAAFVAIALLAAGAAVEAVLGAGASSVGGPAVPKHVRRCLARSGLAPQFDNRFARLGRGFIGGFRVKPEARAAVVISIYSSDLHAASALPQIRAIVADNAGGGAVRHRNVVISSEGAVAKKARSRAARCATSGE